MKVRVKYSEDARKFIKIHPTAIENFKAKAPLLGYRYMRELIEDLSKISVPELKKVLYPNS